MWGAIFILAGVIAICVCVGILLVGMLNSATRELEQEDRREMDRLRFKAKNMEYVTRDTGERVLVSTYDMYPPHTQQTQTSSVSQGGSAMCGSRARANSLRLTAILCIQVGA